MILTPAHLNCEGFEPEPERYVLLDEARRFARSAALIAAGAGLIIGYALGAFG